MSTHWHTCKSNVADLHTGILFSHEKEESDDISYNMNIMLFRLKCSPQGLKKKRPKKIPKDKKTNK